MAVFPWVASMTLIVGSHVRLNGGWTRMVILSIDSFGKCYAAYWHKSYQPKPAWFENPREYSDQHRHISGFTNWDGHPMARQLNEEISMSLRYMTNFGAQRSGTYLTRTSNGDFVLEMDDNVVESFHPSELIELIAYTAKVQSVKTSYSCEYSFAQGVTVSEGDLLISDSGNMYKVMKTNTKCRQVKKEFKGRRLVTEPL
jgi:uncharacterized protein YodC (DUF2158 family)